MVTISNLTQRKNKIIADATSLVNAGLNSSEQKEQYRKLLAEANDVQEHIDMLSTIERKMPNLPAPALAPVAVSAPVSESPEQRKAKRNVAWRNYLANGESRDLLTTGSAGALIPQEFDSAYTQALKFFGPVATLVKQAQQDTGAPRKFIYSDDTAATMTYLAEDGSADGVEADPTISSVIKGTDALVTMLKYSVQGLDDTFSLDAFIQDLVGLRTSRAVEHALTLGKDNGSNTQLPNSPTGGLLGSVTTGLTLSSGTLSTGPTYANLVALAGSVDHAYYVNGSFMVNPATFAFLVSQVDSTGRPLYKFDKDTGLLMVAGRPVYVNNAMAAYNTASSPAVLFGDFSRAYAYLNAGGMRIRVLQERFMDTLERAAVIYHRMGAASLLTTAVKSLVTAAS